MQIKSTSINSNLSMNTFSRFGYNLRTMDPLKPHYVVAIIVIIVNCASTLSIFDRVVFGKPPQDASLDFTQLAEKYGHKCEEYTITTEDGYILTVFNIVGDKKRPVFLLHGCFETADTYVIRGNTSLAITLADAGYDVWVGNHRGNKYSRQHVTLNPDTDKQYWDFSFHEIGYYDLPATIDFILEKTCTNQLQAVGFSQGTTAFYVLTSKRPEYNEKIKILISLAPIAYLRNVNGPLLNLLKMEPLLSDLTETLEKRVLFGPKSHEMNFINAVCKSQFTGYLTCVKGILFPMSGFDEEELEPDFLPMLVGHYPAPLSRKNGKHLVMLKNNFTEYDYGSATNLEVYNSTDPPAYDLKQITMKIALYVGKNDRMSVIKDVELLRSQLSNVVEYHIMEREKFNHLDFVVGKHMHVYLFPHILRLLEEHY